VIEKDFIMIDEGQDTNPAVFDIFRRQGGHAQLIMVGDSYQSIYQWRGAIDAMAAFEEAVNHVHLTKSFRFGEAVANEANKWLKMLGAVKPLVGFEEIESEVCELDLPRAILCRTNAQVIAETLAAQEHDKKVYVQGGTYEIEQFAKGARDLMQGQPSNHPELIGFKSWDDVVAYVNADKSAKDLRTYVKVIDDYGVEKVLTITERCVDRETYADVTTSTAHKSKGKEWESVRIASDFSEPEDDMETGQPARLTESEMRLAYVAVTRAQRQLDCTALEWVDRWVARYAAGEPITKSHDKLTEQEAAQEAATA
jgi:superfamily I DNA/RNA helicase